MLLGIVEKHFFKMNSDRIIPIPSSLAKRTHRVSWFNPFILVIQSFFNDLDGKVMYKIHLFQHLLMVKTW